jgi:large subunit ribosomal protein L7A
VKEGLALKELNSTKTVVGVKQVLRAIEAGQVAKVIIASDAEEKVTTRIKEMCLQKGITMEDAETMKQLGKENGIQVGAAVVAILT